MKKRKLWLPAMAGLYLVACSVACKKNDAPVKQSCNIVAAITGNNAIAFTYNAEGKLSTKNGTTTDKFFYKDNNITIINSTGSVLNSTTTVELNANGLATRVKIVNAAGITTSNTIFEYNGTELSKSTVSGSSGGAPEITVFTWSGGNMVSFQVGGNTESFEYALDKPAQAGDFFNFQSLVQGFENLRTRNLVKSITAGSLTNFNYTFDDAGKITTLTAISNGLVVLPLNYQYECN